MSDLLISTFAGLVVGGGALAMWLWRRNPTPAHTTLDTPTLPQTTDSPLELKLRNAIYECEQQALACEDEIFALCQYQLELLRDVGKPSFMGIADKELFFKYTNPILQESRYYYVRDLDEQANPDILEQTRQILENYNVHILLFHSKWALFQKLLASHRQNLDRLAGLDIKTAQLHQLQAHRERLAQLDNKRQIDLETSQLRQLQLLTHIEEEVNFQEECFNQYVALNNAYNTATELSVYQTFRIEIEQLIGKLEDKDPSRREA